LPTPRAPAIPIAPKRIWPAKSRNRLAELVSTMNRWSRTRSRPGAPWTVIVNHWSGASFSLINVRKSGKTPSSRVFVRH
jgi:hypothetical protein